MKNRWSSFHKKIKHLCIIHISYRYIVYTVDSSSFVPWNSRKSQKSHGMPRFNNTTHRLLAPISFSIEILSQFDAREIWHLLSRFSAWPEKTLYSTESRTYFFSDYDRVLVSFPPSYCLARATLTFVYLDQTDCHTKYDLTSKSKY